MHIEIPGREPLDIKHLVLDFNGTVAVGGRLREGVGPLLRAISKELKVHILTSDTYGTVVGQSSVLPVSVHVLEGDDHTGAKERYVLSLGKDCVAAVGNGSNDIGMLKQAALAIAVVEGEGCSSGAALASDILVKSSLDALQLFLDPQRIKATLRE